MLETLFRRVWHLINRRRFERELLREMEEHRDELDDPRRFGDTHRLLEQSRDAWGWNWLDDAAQDFRQGMRALARSPAFAITGTLMLAFGIGLNLTLYQIISVALLRPRPIQAPDTLVQFHRHAPNSSSNGLPYALGEALATEQTPLSAVLMQADTSVYWDDRDAAPIEAQFVSTNWFTELGYGAALGRVFAPQIDDAATTTPAVVVSHSFWTTRLGADPEIIGRTAIIDRRPVTIAGVARADFPEFELDRTAVWIPISRREYFYPDSDFLRTWHASNTNVFGRLQQGVSIAVARDRLRQVMTGFAQSRPDAVGPNEWLEPISALDNFRPPRMRNEMGVVVSLAGMLTLLVLAIAAANLGNLVLARATGRVRELGIRIALGARRSRITRQLLIEALPLAICGTTAALLASWWGTLVIARAADLPPYLQLAPDTATIAVAAMLMALTLVVIAAIPAWQVAKQDLTVALKDGGQQVTLRLDRTLVRRLMLGAQITFSCIVIALAGMMARTAQRVLSSDLGFEYEQVARLSAPLGRWGVTGDAAREYWYHVKARIAAHSQVRSVALVTSPPMGGSVNRTRYDDARSVVAMKQAVEPEYFDLMRIRIVRGRIFANDEDPATAAIVSERLARAMYGSIDVLGRGFPRSQPERTIVGVAADAHTVIVTATDVTELYMPLTREDYDSVQLLIASRGDPATLVPSLRQAAEEDGRIIATVTLSRDDFARRTEPARLVSAITGVVGVVALLLACLGIVGVVSYSIGARRKEIGIHAALGARRAAMVRLMTRQVLVPIAAGALLGIAVAAPVGMLLAGQPFYLISLDPGVYAFALILLLGCSTAAAVVPALRNLRADPIRALRHD